MSVSERSEALFLCPKFERYFGVFYRFRGFGRHPNKSQAGVGIYRCPACENAPVITDALLARNENNKITEGGDEDDYEFLIFHTEDEGMNEIDRIEERLTIKSQ